MKHIIPTIIIIILLYIGCKQSNTTTSEIEEKNSISIDDTEQIRNLIRNALYWGDTKNSIDLLPTIIDSKDSVNIGFDLEKHNQNLEKFRRSDFFAEEFIDNYDQIIKTLDKGLRDEKQEQWLVGDLPPFRFLNDVNPWCECQGIPYNEPNPFNRIEINVINANTGEIEWDWGKPESNWDEDLRDFTYKFRVVKENGKWKISYLEGFDFKESTRKDGVL